MLVIPPPPLIKVASNTKPYSKLGGTTLNGREEGGQYYISQTCDQERFEARKVSSFLHLVVLVLHTPIAMVKRGAFLAPKEVVIKNSISFS